MFAFSWTFVVLLFSWFFQETACTSIVQQQVVKYIDELCPGANVCRANDTAPRVRFPPGMKSCCTACSCSETCRSNRNCCFPATDKRENYKNQVCISTWTPEIEPENQHLYTSYYMYADLPTGGCLRNTRKAMIDDEPIAPWGNVYPVYSNSTGKIYLNDHLAECYDASDLIKWRAELVCRQREEDTGTIIDIASNVESLFTVPTSHCRVHFHYPGDIEDIEAEQCYLDMIDSCENTEFEVPSGINMSSDEVRQACESGFYSPYVYSANFANVFCSICNSHTFEEKALCRDKDRRTMTNKPFIFLLDADLVRGIPNKRHTVATHDEKMACQTTQSFPSECRVINCPTGQLKYVNGSCLWPFKKMLDSHFALFLKLEPSASIPADMIATNNVNVYPPWLTSPWSNAWNVWSIYYETSVGEIPVVRRIWVEQKIKTNRRMDKLVRKIRLTLPKQWIASVSGNKTKLNQTIDVYKIFHSGYFRMAGDSIKTNSNIYGLYDNNEMYTQSVFITKMFLCDQVELFEHEYVLAPSHQAMTYVRTNRTFYEGEFTYIHREGGPHTVRICLEDSDFVLRVSGCPGLLITCKMLLLYCLASVFLTQSNN